MKTLGVHTVPVAGAALQCVIGVEVLGKGGDPPLGGACLQDQLSFLGFRNVNCKVGAKSFLPQ